MTFKLKIISSSIRIGRKGPLLLDWITEVARKHTEFDVEALDLGVVNLPMMNEPHHPMLRKYEFDYTKQWAATIDTADAFIFVTAEYDYNYPAPLRNAIEYLAHEWAYKPAGIVSYGGISAGTRAANSLKADLSTLRVVPLAEAVNIPFFTQFINVENKFVASEQSEKAAEKMLHELLRYTKGMKLIKENKF